MNYCEEIAVLQAAAKLADEICATSGGLHKFSKGQDDNTQVILASTVQEITTGLRRDRTRVEQQLWEERMTLVLTLAYTAGDNAQLWEDFEISDVFAGALSGMPAISFQLLYELVKSCQLLPHLVEIIDNLDRPAALHLLHSLVQAAQDESDEDDAVIIETIAVYIMHHRNNLLGMEGLTILNENLDRLRERELMLEIRESTNELFLRALELRNLDPVGCVAMLQTLLGSLQNCRQLLQPCTVLLGLLNLLVKTTDQGSPVCIYPLDEKDVQHFLEIKEKLAVKCADKDEESTVKLSVSLHCRLEHGCRDGDSVLSIPIIMLNTLLETVNQIFSDYDMLHIIQSNFNLTTSSEQIFCGLSPQQLGELLDTAVSALRDQQTSLQSNLLSASALESTLDSLTQLQHGLDSWTTNCLILSTEDRWTLATFIVEQQLPHFHEDFAWILTEAPQNDKRWLEFLEKNYSYIDKNGILFLLRKLQEASEKPQCVQYFGRLKQVLIGAFRRLPIREKNEVLVAAHPMVSSLLAPNNSRDFGKILTVTFNMIVSSKQEHGKTTAEDIAVLAIEDPCAVIEKVVETAVNNAGQTDTLVKVLGDLWGLCAIQKGEESQSLLVHCLQHLTSQHLSIKQRDNLLTFITLLQTGDDNSLLQPSEVLQYLVLPRAFQYDLQSPDVTLTLLALEIMLTSLNVCKESCDWLFAFHTPPIAYCLCELTVRSRQAWLEQDCDEAAQCMLVLERALNCLSTLVDILRFNTDRLPGAGMRWLYEQMRKLPWHTSLHLLPLYDAYDHNLLPLMLPENYTKLIDLHGRTVKCCAKEDDLQVFLEFASATDASLQILVSSVKLRSALSCLSYNRFTVSFSHFMEVHTAEEISRAVQLLLLVCRDGGHLPTPSQCTVPELRGELWLLDVLQACAVVVASHRCNSYCVLQHFTRSTVTLLQSFCMPGLHIDPAVTATLLTRLFVCVSQQVAALPDVCEDPMLVVALQALSHLVDLTETTLDTAVHESVLLWSPEKQTLLKKTLGSSTIL